MNESIPQKATDAMRAKAKSLEIEAMNWRHLADRLDEMENYAKSQQIPGTDGPVPYFGTGSQAEQFLRKLTI